ncbi:high-affinity cGMP-specific 3',5'-cyclic phosphodiesterase 9A [Thecamonas trahens ATCC 50062]|uniref:Phosphodiesterase n=1 Tax=Thecamonas trahens ATCC 50062 TaxID=461836 RepID=A0A0L0D7U6_THETB|nr:high-affinity cGMP-specific 3',5'-cyclic phosphodiesterase 9A [Thecamonas trahens ATCC 50062]KNC48136.1 high-affinity cGMP-specific 3',5'-cyclic phosphodiesterase 9A [Thecamonas trahens ATCC 50062]|eukprot:XP_013758706.1 high-affinity cGMP-specific 3',5'-cyclic phosphodiesterase 9A [Thecamonas trahens ATCC 50062]
MADSASGQRVRQSSKARSGCSKAKCKTPAHGLARYCPKHAGSARSFITTEVRDALRSVEFDMWRYSKEELVYLFEAMFEDTGLVYAFSLEEDVLLAFLNAVKANYNDNPFHNLYHSFCVTQMVFTVLMACNELPEFLDEWERLALMVSAVCHDLDHDGVNNSFHINSKSELAVIYNDQSCLENHHCSQAFRILHRPPSNLLSGYSEDEYKKFRKLVIGCVLSTDMGRHFDILGRFDKLIAPLRAAGASLTDVSAAQSVDTDAPTFDFGDAGHRALLAQIVLMCCDISNEVRPFSVSRIWADRLVEEFGNQVDREKAMGLPFLPFMDRDQVVLEKSQIGFIAFLLRPLWVSASVLLPPLGAYVDAIDENYQQWSVVVQRNASNEMLRLLSNLHPEFEEQTVDAGTVLCRKDEDSDELFFVHEGDVCVVDEQFDRVLNTFTTGCFFGEIAVLKGIPRTANVVAKTEARIHVASKDMVLALLDDHPDFRKTLEQVATIREGVIHRNAAKGLQSIGLGLIDHDQLVHMGGG